VDRKKEGRKSEEKVGQRREKEKKSESEPEDAANTRNTRNTMLFPLITHPKTPRW